MSASWKPSAHGHYSRADGVSIRRHGRGEWVVHNAAGLIACRPGGRGIALSGSLADAKAQAAHVSASAPAFHAASCGKSCPGHERLWRGHVVCMEDDPERAQARTVFI